jgi:hypothetical protein
LSEEEREQVAAWSTAHPGQGAVRPAGAVSEAGSDVSQSSSQNATAGDEAALPLRQKLTGLFRRGAVQP